MILALNSLLLWPPPVTEIPCQCFSTPSHMLAQPMRPDSAIAILVKEAQNSGPLSHADGPAHAASSGLQGVDFFIRALSLV